jgi:hypothetical protein
LTPQGKRPIASIAQMNLSRFSFLAGVMCRLRRSADAAGFVAYL